MRFFAEINNERGESCMCHRLTICGDSYWRSHLPQLYKYKAAGKSATNIARLRLSYRSTSIRGKGGFVGLLPSVRVLLQGYLTEYSSLSEICPDVCKEDWKLVLPINMSEVAMPIVNSIHAKHVLVSSSLMSSHHS